MKIKVSNLGPLRGPAEFDLKPLTILIGPNNAGKTWLAYILGSIFRSHSILPYMQGDELENISKHYLPLTKAVDELLTTGATAIDLCQFSDEYSETYFNTIASRAPEWARIFLSTRRVFFHGLEISIKLGATKRQIANRILASSLKSNIGLAREASDIDDDGKLLLSINKRAGQKDVYLYTFSEGQIDEKLPHELIEERLAWNVLRMQHEALYSNVEFLPTERATFITSRSYLSGKPIAPVSEPVTSYLDLVAAIYITGAKTTIKREKDAKIIPAVKEYIQLAELLEEYILGGKLDFSTIDPTPEREIIFQPTGSTQTLEISVASSMVQQLTPLVFYLRYFAQPHELLIIDEPEMDLHPKAQVQILEFLAMLVNAGLHVLVTTHSPYIIDHITNLCKADEHTDTEKEAIHSEFFLQDKRAFIAKDKTAVYLVDNGTIVDAMDDELEEDTFGKVSDSIADIYFKL